ncbi:MAG: Uma2 family endonuclease [Acidimicrobiales bacterium]
MRGVLLEVPSELLAERARQGVDVFDEMWEGELHMAPPPSEEHQRIGGELFIALHGTAVASGLVVRYETGLFDPTAPEGSDYRVPDLMVFAASQRSERGVEGDATLVVEIRSPGGESLDKVAFYQRVGVREIVMIDRDTKDLRHWRRVDDALVKAEPAGGTPVALSELAVTLQAVDGRLAVETAGERTLI